MVKCDGAALASAALAAMPTSATSPARRPSVAGNATSTSNVPDIDPRGAIRVMVPVTGGRVSMLTEALSPALIWATSAGVIEARTMSPARFSPMVTTGWPALTV
jgi:hypothetical protein